MVYNAKKYAASSQQTSDVKNTKKIRTRHNSECISISEQFSNPLGEKVPQFLAETVDSTVKPGFSDHRE